LRRAETHAQIVGWEANRGFLTSSDIRLTAGTLISLPTRDSTLPILANLFAAAEQRIGLAALWNRLPARFGRAGLLDNVPVAVSQAILAHLIPPGDVIEVEFYGTGRVLDRSRSGAPPTPLTEPATQDWQQRNAMLMRFFTPALGFGDIMRINVLDGVRVYFRNGGVAHVRPSGNAP
jgi:phosphomannomutase